MIRGMMFSRPDGFVLHLDANAYNPNFRSLALAAGWNGADKVFVMLNAETFGAVSVLSSWSFPGGIEIHISPATTLYGSRDDNDGHGLLVQRAVTVNNLGRIYGRGRGLGSGAVFRARTSEDIEYFATGGQGGAGKAITPSLTFTTQYGQVGGFAVDGSLWMQGQDGANGADWGSDDGGDGGNVNYSGGWFFPTYTPKNATVGMPRGNAVKGNNYVTWINVGTTLGGLVN